MWITIIIIIVIIAFFYLRSRPISIPAPQFVRMSLVKKMFIARSKLDSDIVLEVSSLGYSPSTVPDEILITLPEFTILRATEQYMLLSRTNVPNDELVQLLNMQEKMGYTMVGEDIEILPDGSSIEDFIAHLLDVMHSSAKFSEELIRNNIRTVQDGYNFIPLAPVVNIPPILQKGADQIIDICFPLGKEQMHEEATQLHALLKGRIDKDTALRTLVKAKSLLCISKDKSESRIVESVLNYTNGKLTVPEAKLVYRFLTGYSGEMYGGGDGSSIEEAVTINATSSLVGVPAEYEWITNKFGEQGTDWKNKGREHGQTGDGRYLEIFTLELTNGTEVIAVFDISSFFGRT